MSRYVTISDFAKQCGVSRQLIHQRIDRGEYELETHRTPTGRVRVLNTDTYPPEQNGPRGKGGRPRTRR